MEYDKNMNKAKLIKKEIIDHSDCEECNEEYIFMLKDKEHEFQLGLRKVLSMLAFAEEEGAIPTLPDSWWIDIRNRYDQPFH